MTARQSPTSAVLWRRRLIPVAGLAAVALIAGVVKGATHHDGRIDVAERYARAWVAGDYDAMYALLDDSSRKDVDRARFASIHRDALRTATEERMALAGKVRIDGDVADLPMVVATRIFGTLRAPVRLALSGDGDDARVDWERANSFPGLERGERLKRTTTMPPRGTIATRDGQILARGDGRAPDASVADIADDTVGEIGPIPPERAAELKRLGVPSDAKVGIRGLERALDTQLLGRPGGTLAAGDRILKRVDGRRAGIVRSTIAPSVERAAVEALAGTGKTGGVVALDPRNGELLGFAGIAFSGLQPPGSTFKIITASSALENDAVKLTDQFPVETAATLEGVELANANGESCGGSFVNSFAESCNSVFAPLGAKLGGEKLVKTAEEFGFNAPPDIAGAAESTIPQGDQIGDDLALGSTAIGQGLVQATALQMGSVAATIAERGRRPQLTLELDATADGRAPTRRAIDTTTARQMEKLMLAVVRSGTGTAAAIPGVKVAGKTGTAELKNTHDCAPDPSDPASEGCQSTDDPSDTDAWFSSYAPAGGKRRPRVAVGVMLVGAGAGGDSAAPVAKQIMQAALKRG